MSNRVYNTKIFWSVVSGVSVDVMNVLGSEKRSSEGLFHHNSVLRENAIPYSNLDVFNNLPILFLAHAPHVSVFAWLAVPIRRLLRGFMALTAKLFTVVGEHWFHMTPLFHGNCQGGI